MTMIATRDRTRRTLCTTLPMMPVDRTVAAKFTKMAAVASVLAMSLVALPGIASAACDLFEHQRVDVGGELIAVTGNAGTPLDNDWALYGIVDQLIWRVPGSEDPQGVSVFARFAGAPEDRNLVDFYFDAGFTFTGMIPGRPNDCLLYTSDAAD